MSRQQLPQCLALLRRIVARGERRNTAQIAAIMGVSTQYVWRLAKLAGVEDKIEKRQGREISGSDF